MQFGSGSTVTMDPTSPDGPAEDAVVAENGELVVHGEQGPRRWGGASAGDHAGAVARPGFVT